MESPKALTLKLSSKRSQKPKFQCLIAENGQTPVWLEAMELISLGECLMPGIGEFPSADVESSLWQVLENNAPVKYYLSKRACEGIIRRAKVRGKVLPELLETALLYRIETADCEIFKDIGDLVFRIVKFTRPDSDEGFDGYNDNLTESKLLASGIYYGVLLKQNDITDNQSSVIDNQNGITDNQKSVYGLGSHSSNGMKSANPHNVIYEAETTRTLDGQGGNPSCNQGGMIIVELAILSTNQNLRDFLWDFEYGRNTLAVLNDQGGESISVEKSDISPTLRRETHGHLPVIAKEMVREAVAVHESISGDRVYMSDIAYALRSGRKPLLLEGINPLNSKEMFVSLHPDIAPTITASAGGTSRPGGAQGNELDYYMAYALQGNMIGRADHNGPQGNGINEDCSFTLNTGDFHAVAFYNHTHTHKEPTQGDTASCQMARQNKKTPVDLILQLGSGYKVTGTIMANCGEKRFLGNQEAFGGNYHVVGFIEWIPHYIVRRLTPTECERLQGFPDGWTKYGADNDKQIADTPRYQMLGNSLAIPCVQFIMKNIVRAETCAPPGIMSSNVLQRDRSAIKNREMNVSVSETRNVALNEARNEEKSKKHSRR